MGRFNSSKTRVNPVFDALYAIDSTGRSWLPLLLGLGSRSQSVSLPNDIGDLSTSPRYEMSADPPKAYLQWLIEHPAELTSPPPDGWSQWSLNTRTKRYAWLTGDTRVALEASASLASCIKLPARPWWRLEGVTRVDCALLTPSTLVFIEGKRTEQGASRSVVWHKTRNQVLRLLDCASEFACTTGRPDHFVLLIAERALVERDPSRQREIDTIVTPQTVAGSLPHLEDAERQLLLNHYLGVTYWEDIVSGFRLGERLLSG